MTEHTSAQQRIVGLDTWRVILLLIGPMMHGGYVVSTVSHRVQWIDTIIQASHSFRMAAFFSVSGFLLGHRGSLQRLGWISARLRELLIPALAVWVLFLIPMTVLIQVSGQPSPSYFAPHHLWFLLELALMTLLLKYFEEVGLNFFLENRSVPALLTFIALVPPFYIAGVKAAPLFTWGMWIDGLALLPFYTLFFQAGYIIARSKRVKEWLSSSNVPLIGSLLLPLSLTLYNVYYDEWLPPMRSQPIYRFTYYVAQAGAAIGMTAAILASSLRLKSSHSVTKYLRSAAFTIYLVHYPVVILFGTFIEPLPVSDVLNFLLVAGVGLLTSFLFHELVVCRSNYAKLLFNGKPVSSP